MGFNTTVVSCQQGDSLLEHRDALIALQTNVDSKKVKKTFAYSDFEEMVGNDLSISLLCEEGQVGGIMFNLKKNDALKNQNLTKVQNITGIRKVEKSSYRVANETNTGYDDVNCVEVLFDRYYPTTAFNIRRIAGIIDMALGTHEKYQS